MLARLLGPHQFGIYAVAYVAFRVLVNFNDLGVGLAIVRWTGEPNQIAPTVSTIAVSTSVLLYLGCYFGAPAYCATMGAPGATSVVRVLSIVVVVDGIVATPIGLLTRHFRQDLRMIADQVNVWLGTAVTVVLALLGYGAMSLAIGRLIGCLAALILLISFSPEPLRFGFDPIKARALLRFGPPLAGSAVVAFAVANVDQIIVGRVLGVTALGFFVLASNLSSWPVSMFSLPVRGVAPAAFARLQDDPPAMRSGFLSAAGLLAAVTLPVCLTITGSASPLIAFVYGGRWIPAAQALVWLAGLAAAQIFFELTYDYFVVLAMSRVVLTLQVVWLIVLIPMLIVGARLHGIAGLSMAEFAVAAGLVLPWYLLELRKVGIRTNVLAARLWLPLTGGGLAGVAAFLAARTAPNDVVALACSCTAGLLIIGFLMYRMRAVLAMLRRPGAKQPAPGVVMLAQQVVGPIPEGVAAGDLTGTWARDGARQPAAANDVADVLTVHPEADLLPPFRIDYTGPIELGPDWHMSMAAYRGGPEASLPLYRQTVASQRWDPAHARADLGATPGRLGADGYELAWDEESVGE
jgi:O-antigen/teichoic acid export membrane protein